MEDGEIDIDTIVDDQSPVLQNIEIRRLRLINVLDKVLENIEIAYALEDLTKDNGLLIAPYLSAEDLATVLSINEERNATSGIQGHSSRTLNKSFINKSRSKKGQIGVMSALENRQSLLTTTMLQILNRNKKIRQLAKDIVNQFPDEKLQFIQYMTEFRNIAVKKFYKTATDERNSNKKIATVWEQNEKLKERNIEMGKVRDAKYIELSQKIFEKNSIIEEQKEKIIKMKASCIDELQRIVNKSEYLMAKSTLTSNERQEILAVEAKSVTNQYYLQLERDLAEEKILRTKRYKLETVLANWLNTYDVDIGELQAQLEVLSDGYEKEKAELEELQDNYDKQEVYYIELMEEKAAEEQRILEKRRADFVANRAAKIIQRWIRAILARKRRRRGRKKGRRRY